MHAPMGSDNKCVSFTDKLVTSCPRSDTGDNGHLKDSVNEN